MDNYKNLVKILGGNEVVFLDEDLDKTVCFFCYMKNTEIAAKTTEALSLIYSKFYKPEHAYNQAIRYIDFICQQLDRMDSKKTIKFQKFYRKTIGYYKKMETILN